MRKEHTLLLVDDEPHVIEALKRVLLDLPVEILSASSGKEALRLLKEREVHVIISDERMPQMSGSEFLTVAREERPSAVRMMLTGHASLEAAMRAVNDGEIYRFFLKPWNDVEILLAVRSACERYDLEEENRRLLRMVRIHEYYLKNLEQNFPDLPRHETDGDGNILLANVSAGEVDRLLDNIGG